MANDVVAPGASGWKKKIVIVLGILVALVVAVYLTATSAAFLKGFILPKVAKQIGAEITLEDASISPFSSVTLRKLTVKTGPGEPLLAVEEVQLRYALMGILGGKINASQVTVVSPVIRYIVDEKGGNNLDPILKKLASKPAVAEEKEKEGAAAPVIDIRNIEIRNAAIFYSKAGTNGSSEKAEITGLDVKVDKVANGEQGVLTIASTMKALMTPAKGKAEEASGMGSKLAGSITFQIDKKLKPAMVKGGIKLSVESASGMLKELATLATALEVDTTGTEIRQLGVSFEKAGRKLGGLSVSGPFNVETTEGKLQVNLTGIDREVLNLAGAMAGIDFGRTKFSSSNLVELERKGKLVVVKGQFSGTEIEIKKGTLAPPPIEIQLGYQASIDLAASTALIQTFSLNGSKGGSSFLGASMDRPIPLSWGQTANGFKESSLSLELKKFDLAEWRSVLGTNVASGVIDSSIGVTSEEDGKVLRVRIATTAANVGADANGVSLRRIGAKFNAEAILENVITGPRILTVSNYSVEITQAGKALATVTGSARSDLAKGEHNATVSAEVVLAEAATIAPVKDLAIRNGQLRISTKLDSKPNRAGVSGRVQLDAFSGELGAYKLENTQAELELNVEKNGDTLEIHRVAMALTQGYDKGGSVDVTGSIHLPTMAGQVQFKAVDINQNLLKTVLAPALGKNQLVSISINSSGTATLDPKGENAVKAEVTVGKWVVKDPAGKFPTEPLDVALNVDAGMKGQTLNLRELGLKLTPTARAKNILQVSGKLDLAATNASPSTVSVKAESLDVTPYYNLFAGEKGAPKKAPEATAPASDPNQEAPAVDLPIKDLTADVRIGQFYLREINLSNIVAVTTIKKGEVTIKPMQMNVNGAPVNAEVALNLGVPGYIYDIAFTADKVPLEPFANSFATNAAGMVQGTLIANAKIKGAGTTGASIQKNLSGAIIGSATNLNMQLVTPGRKRIIQPIAMLLGVGELLQSPVNWLDARADIGGGKVNISQAAVESEAFQAKVTGIIELATVLTNSPLNLPVELSLRYSLAQKANLLSSETPTNAKFAALPNFVQIKGTAGKPEPELNKLVIAGMLTKSSLRLPVAVGGEAGKLLQGAGNFLTGQKSSTNAPASSTNAPANALGKAVEGLGGLFGGKKEAAKTNAPPATNNAPGKLLDLFKK